MKRIAISVLTITVVAIVGFAVTRAFFSDTETSTGNTITAGSIDISVDTNNPWSESGTIADMKPSYVRWTKHVVRNVGTNPIKLWKHIKDVTTQDNGQSESECTEGNGTWNDGDESCGNGYHAQNNIDEFIEYDMYIGGDVNGSSTNNWLGGSHTGGKVIIDEKDGITVHDIESVFVFLGEIAPDDSIIVWQSYHMKDETGNWAQTDELTYTIEFYAEQVNGTGPISGGPIAQGPYTLLLENKDVDGTWDPIISDGKWGVLKWTGDGDTFDFSSTAHGLLSNTDYSLIYYPEPQNTWPWPVTIIDSGQSDGDGNLTLADNVNLGVDLTNAKLWLVVSSDLVSGEYSMWPPTDTLFEYSLINYNDTDN